MRVHATTDAPRRDERRHHRGRPLRGRGHRPRRRGHALPALVDAGEAGRACASWRSRTPRARRFILAGLGSRESFDAERARVVAAVGTGAPRSSARGRCAGSSPTTSTTTSPRALVEGTVLAAYRFDRYKSEREDPNQVEELARSPPTTTRRARRARAAILADAQNAARDLQNTPANDMTPTELGARARALAAELDGARAPRWRAATRSPTRGMGAFAAVAQGSDEEPALITLRYEGPGAQGETLGFVGKAVTFDSGGISIKPSAKMAEMKFDMSGGAAVLEAVARDRRLRLPVRVIGVVGATENMPSGPPIKPGDIVRASNGTTIEINNTDAEGRLVLADCLVHARDAGRHAAGRSGDADRRDRRRPRVHPRRPVAQRRRLGRGVPAAGERDRRAALAAAAAPRVRRADQGPLRGHRQRHRVAARRARSRPRSSCARFVGRHALGAPGHRGHGLGPGPALRRQGRRRASACGCWWSWPAAPPPPRRPPPDRRVTTNRS